MTTDHTAHISGVPMKLGDMVELTNGSANDNIRDANAWYWWFCPIATSTL